jgi:hypothetical protein
MKFVLACAALMTLTACASPGTPRTALEDASITASGFMPIAMAPLPDSFCDDVAASDQLRAQQAGFDAATISRMSLQSAQQCRVLAGNISRAELRVASR